jgi:hypothetical protein
LVLANHAVAAATSARHAVHTLPRVIRPRNDGSLHAGRWTAGAGALCASALVGAHAAEMAGRHPSRSREGPRIAGRTSVRATPAALEHWIKVRVKAREAGDAGNLRKLGKVEVNHMYHIKVYTRTKGKHIW